jgi:hypothetical protein
MYRKQKCVLPCNYFATYESFVLFDISLAISTSLLLFLFCVIRNSSTFWFPYAIYWHYKLQWKLLRDPWHACLHFTTWTYTSLERLRLNDTIMRYLRKITHYANPWKLNVCLIVVVTLVKRTEKLKAELFIYCFHFDTSPYNRDGCRKGY